MKYTVGIDLGSTTTKAAVLSEEGRILGRGITNSRSNYDMACQIALSEALINTRFSLVASEMNKAGLDKGRREELLSELERKFRLEQYLVQLRALEEELGKLLARLNPSGAHHASVEKILSRMKKEAEELYRVLCPEAGAVLVYRVAFQEQKV